MELEKRLSHFKELHFASLQNMCHFIHIMQVIRIINLTFVKTVLKSFTFIVAQLW